MSLQLWLAINKNAKLEGKNINFYTSLVFDYYQSLAWLEKVTEVS